MDARGEVAGVTEDVQVAAKARRRMYTAEYKRRILKEADASTVPGAIGALLRREGLYSSLLVEWRRARGCARAGSGGWPRDVGLRMRLESRGARPRRRAACPNGSAVGTRGVADGPPWSSPGAIGGCEWRVRGRSRPLAP